MEKPEAATVPAVGSPVEWLGGLGTKQRKDDVMKTIKFNGEEYLFGGDSLDESDFIAKVEDYENGACSYAHYFPERGVLRFGQQIGTRDDIEIISDCDVEPNLDVALLNMVVPRLGGWPL
jgi:hypothetical protein